MVLAKEKSSCDKGLEERSVFDCIDLIDAKIRVFEGVPLVPGAVVVMGAGEESEGNKHY